MPGRRSPRRPAEVARVEHSRGAFRGALDGSSSIPAPVDERPPPEAQRQIRFVTEYFYGSGAAGSSKYLLSNVPIPGSVNVYRQYGESGST